MLTYSRPPLQPAVRFAPGYSLGQVLSAGFQVVVTDPAGRPFRAIVTLDVPGGAAANTDSSGVATFDGAAAMQATRGGKVPISIVANGLVIKREVPVDQTAFIVIPMCAPQPIVTVSELIAFAAGATLVGAGMYLKKSPLQVAGEVLFGAAIFTAVYRHSCGS